MQCGGWESSLFDCKHRRKDNCGGSEGAGVRCGALVPSGYELGPPVTDEELHCDEDEEDHGHSHCVFPFRFGK